LKTTFFPGWDKRNFWQVKISRGLSNMFASGGCDYSQKIIIIVFEAFETPDQLQATCPKFMLRLPVSQD